MAEGRLGQLGAEAWPFTDEGKRWGEAVHTEPACGWPVTQGHARREGQNISISCQSWGEAMVMLILSLTLSCLYFKAGAYLKHTKLFGSRKWQLMGV